MGEANQRKCYNYFNVGTNKLFKRSRDVEDAVPYRKIGRAD